METKAIPFVLIKSSQFYHDIDQVWIPDPVTGNQINGDQNILKGIEIELETVPWNYFSLASSLSYTEEAPTDAASDDFCKINFNVAYRNPSIINLELFGLYMNWPDTTMMKGEHNSKIRNLNGSRLLSTSETTAVGLFFTIHNLTNKKQYWSIYYQNRERWIEVGLRFSF